MSKSIWYVADEHTQAVGQLAEEDVLRRLLSGGLPGNTRCWREGMSEWVRLVDAEPFASAVLRVRQDAALIQFQCACGNGISMSQKFAGRKIKCSQCGVILRVPGTDHSQSEGVPAALPEMAFEEDASQHQAPANSPAVLPRAPSKTTSSIAGPKSNASLSEPPSPVLNVRRVIGKQTPEEAPFPDQLRAANQRPSLTQAPLKPTMEAEAAASPTTSATVPAVSNSASPPAEAEVPRLSPSFADEARIRITTTWKCPSCAEEIQKEAQKCRSCGIILTMAVKMGYPAFYENVAKRGLSSTWLMFDYGDHLYPDEGGIDSCGLSASSPLLALFDSREDEKAKVLRLAGGIVKAMKERLSHIPADSQEALTLRVTCQYLWMVRDFARPGNPGNDPKTLEFAISCFTKLRQALPPIEPKSRRELEEQLDDAIRACQNQLGARGGLRGESSSTAGTESGVNGNPCAASSEPAELPRRLMLDLGTGPGVRALFGSHLQLELLLIPAGRFTMGSPLNEEGRTELECPPLDVTISKPYYIGKYPVTQEQYGKIMGRNLSGTRGTQNPVDRVSWNDADEFCRRLSALTGQMVRLPTEAEWEYACRAGTTTRFYSGDSESGLKRMGWYGGNSGQRTHPVGKKAPNAWGLYDMHGNVYEWCRDFSDNPTQRSGQMVDPQGPEYGSVHPLRGGCWGSTADECRSAGGMECGPDPRNNTLGFRVVVDPWRRELIAQKFVDSGEADEQASAEDAPPGGTGDLSQPKGIWWGATLQINALRAVAAGLVWCIVFLAAGNTQPVWVPFTFPFALPIAHLLVNVPIGLLCVYLRDHGLQWAGFPAFFFLLAVLPGDPIVFVLHKALPRLVPVKQYGLLSRNLVFWVHGGEE